MFTKYTCPYQEEYVKLHGQLNNLRSQTPTTYLENMYNQNFHDTKKVKRNDANLSNFNDYFGRELPSIISKSKRRLIN